MAAVSFMPFLRPLPPPRAHFVRGFLRRIATTSLHEAEAPVVPPPVVPPTQAALQPLSYHVNRTASKQLPVYQTTKRGGNLRQTKVRKIEGNIQALREEMRSAMGLQEEHIAINHLTKHILIKGWRRLEVIKFLETHRF